MHSFVCSLILDIAVTIQTFQVLYAMCCIHRESWISLGLSVEYHVQIVGDRLCCLFVVGAPAHPYRVSGQSAGVPFPEAPVSLGWSFAIFCDLAGCILQVLYALLDRDRTFYL